MSATRTRNTNRKVSRKVSRITEMAETVNPALESLQVLVGDWIMELSNAAFLPNPADTVKGHISFKWLEHGAFLGMHVGDKPRTPWAIWLISRDESRPGYQMFYYDDRQVSRIYAMSFENGLWKMWRESPGFWQRYEGKVSEDGNTITAQWEKSNDGTSWEHDFDVRYTRVM